MSRSNPVNIPASIEAKLKNLMIERNASYQYLLLRYATERFLYRLSLSRYAHRFILKGGNLFVIWQNGWGYRPTWNAESKWK